MPTINQLRNEIDSRLTNLWPRIVTRQETYFSNHGRYWQGLWTHIPMPSCVQQDSGFPDVAPNLNAVPPDVVGTWANIENFPATLCYRIRIDVYTGGFVATVQVKHNGTVYARSQNYGPQTWRTMAWTALPANQCNGMT